MGALKLFPQLLAPLPLQRESQPCVSTGVYQLDQAIRKATQLNGLPQNAITELIGRGSAGSSTFLVKLLGYNLKKNETIAYIDVSNSLDVLSLSNKVSLKQLLWIQGHNDLENCLNTSILAIQAGGLGMVVLDLKDCSSRYTRRIPISFWQKARLSAQKSKTLLLVLTNEPTVGSAAALTIDAARAATEWRHLSIRSFSSQLTPRKGHQSAVGAKVNWKFA
jgi:RecA/RadA recombinase